VYHEYVNEFFFISKKINRKEKGNYNKKETEKGMKT